MTLSLGQSTCIEVMDQNHQISYSKKISNYIFRFEDKIGQGNFSKVYKGHHQKTGQIVAIKIVELSSVKSQKLQELLFSQIEVIQSLNHPNILKCYQVLKSDNNCYIITEFCNNGDLQTLLKKQKALSETEAYPYIRDIYKGLKYLGDRGIVHRDLKIANVFLHNGEAKIADFGFAKYTNNQNFKDMDIGSPLYMSPEGMIDHIYGMKTDIWSFGVIIYELLHGNTPFQFCKSEAELKKLVVQQNIHMNPSFSYNISCVIKRCMSARLDMRPDAKALSEDVYLNEFFKIHQKEDSKAMSMSSGQNFYKKLPSNVAISKIPQNATTTPVNQNRSFNQSVEPTTQQGKKMINDGGKNSIQQPTTTILPNHSQNYHQQSNNQQQQQQSQPPPFCLQNNYANNLQQQRNYTRNPQSNNKSFNNYSIQPPLQQENTNNKQKSVQYLESPQNNISISKKHTSGAKSVNGDPINNNSNIYTNNDSKSMRAGSNQYATVNQRLFQQRDNSPNQSQNQNRNQIDHKSESGEQQHQQSIPQKGRKAQQQRLSELQIPQHLNHNRSEPQRPQYKSHNNFYSAQNSPIKPRGSVHLNTNNDFYEEDRIVERDYNRQMEKSQQINNSVSRHQERKDIKSSSSAMNLFAIENDRQNVSSPMIEQTSPLHKQMKSSINKKLQGYGDRLQSSGHPTTTTNYLNRYEHPQTERPIHLNVERVKFDDRLLDDGKSNSSWTSNYSNFYSKNNSHVEDNNLNVNASNKGNKFPKIHSHGNVITELNNSQSKNQVSKNSQQQGVENYQGKNTGQDLSVAQKPEHENKRNTTLDTEKNQHLLQTVLQFRQGVSVLHYCRLIFRLITTLRKVKQGLDNLNKKQSQSTQGSFSILHQIQFLLQSSTQDSFAHFVLSALSQLVDHVRQGKIIYEQKLSGQSVKKENSEGLSASQKKKRMKEQKLKEVTQEYLKKYQKDIEDARNKSKESNIKWKNSPTTNSNININSVENKPTTIMSATMSLNYFQQFLKQFQDQLQRLRVLFKNDEISTNKNAHTSVADLSFKFLPANLWKQLINLCYYTIRTIEASDYLNRAIERKSYKQMADLVIENWLAKENYSESLYLKLLMELKSKKNFDGSQEYSFKESAKGLKSSDTNDDEKSV